MAKNPGAPIVFISSTVKDLGEFREAAADAARAAGFLAILSEDWDAKDHPPLEECLKRMDGAHLTLAIVTRRYGWVPNQVDDYKSITWLECGRAEANGQDILPFLLHESSTWPVEKSEPYRLTEAAQNKTPPEQIAALASEVARNDAALAEFKSWVADGRIRRTFTENLDSFRGDVKSALYAWLREHPEFHRRARSHARSHRDPGKYLRDLHQATGYIDIRGLAVGSGKAHRFPIEDLYIELNSVISRETAVQQIDGDRALTGALTSDRLVIIGDPGSGKTTFLRWVAHTLTDDRLGLTENRAKTRFGLDKAYLPIVVSIAEWLTHIENTRKNGHCPTTDKDPAWLLHFLENQAESHEQGLDAAWFRQRLKSGEALLMLDGLDEAADRKRRERAVELIETLKTTWPDSPLVVTSRPVAYQDRSVLPGFETARIEPLSQSAVDTFLDLWSQALHPGDAKSAAEHRKELTQALNARPNIRRLASNTVMLTALAVVHWNEKRLPEQRAELYESILTWLARSREQRPGRAGPERSLEVLRVLALAMQNAGQGRQIQIPRREAAERIPDLFDGNVDRAERFLEEEELDSGILVRRDHDVRFWHLTFQEYLAARAVAGMSEAAQQELLLGARARFCDPEWKEVVLLLGGILYEQGRGKVDGLVSAALNNLFSEKNPDLPAQARTFGLLGALVRDLTPFEYRPEDARYLQLRDAVMGIFERDTARTVPVEARIAAAEALGQAGDLRLEDESLRWVEIPGGHFLMGAQSQDGKAPNYDSAARDNETPHRVELDGFLLSRWPLTVVEYNRFVDDNGYRNAAWWEAGGWGLWTEPGRWDDQRNYPNHPLTDASWFESMAYCAWLTDQCIRAGLISEDRVIRLPTETEWEYAARRDSGRRYPWGNSDPNPELLNYDQNIGHVTPVGVYPAGATADGLLDLAGNVWEWCLDWYGKDYYRIHRKEQTIRNPVGPREGDSRVVRGGSWFFAPEDARCAIRNRNHPNNRNNNQGFRVLCAAHVFPWPSITGLSRRPRFAGCGEGRKMARVHPVRTGSPPAGRIAKRGAPLVVFDPERLTFFRRAGFLSNRPAAARSRPPSH